MTFPNPIDNQVLVNTLAVNDRFAITYAEARAKVNPKLDLVMARVPSDGRFERYGYYESAPYVARYEQGDDVPTGFFGAVTYDITNYKYGRALDIFREDLNDDRLGDAMRRASLIAQNAAVHPERVFFQLLTSTTNAELLESIPTAPDGATFFATTAGGAARFGVTDGNLLTGSTVAAVQLVVNDIFQAYEQFGLMLDTQGQPLWDPATIDSGLLLVYGMGNVLIMNQAIRMMQQPWAAGTVSNVAEASVSNIIRDSGLTIQTWPTARITTDDIYVFLLGVEVKATTEQEREPWRLVFADESNSDKSRDSDNQRLIVKGRYGYGINLPYGAVQIDN